MLHLLALIYGLAGSTASLAPYFKKLKKKLSWDATHEKIIFDCSKKAFKDVTGEDLDKFRLKGAVAVLQKVDEYLTTGRMQAVSDTIGDFFTGFKINVKELEKRFEFHLIESGSLEVLTKFNLESFKDLKEIKEVVYKIYETLGKSIPPDVSAALAGIPTLPNPYFAHPYPMQKNFTGREAERAELTEWFTKKPEPMFAYIAIGGMGKSALTWFWLHEDIIKGGLAPEGIIWWSFYDKEARFETFLEKGIQYASRGKIDPKSIDSTRDRMDCLYLILRDNRFLLVLDGVERVLREYAGLGSPYKDDEVKKDDRGDFRTCVDPNVGTFFQWLTSGEIRTKTLLTSRLCPKELDGIGGCQDKELIEMNKQDAAEFFLLQGVKGTRAETERACEPYGYHPLSLRLLSGMILKDPKFQGDIVGWTRHNPIPELTGTQRQHHILALSYDSLDSSKQSLISKLSAFRHPMAYDAISIFNDFGNEKPFDNALIELQDRGLLLRDDKTNRYDLHPIVRSYCYDRLLDKKGVHSQLRDYFSKIPQPDKVESLDDLAPVIELYHHTVNSGRYDEACNLFYERIEHLSHFRFGAHNLRIELLRALFPDGEEKPPRLKKKSDHAWALNSLATSYHLSGRSKKAATLLERQIAIREEQGAKRNLVIGLGNLSMQQIAIGELKSAESNIQRAIELSKEANVPFDSAVCHQELGRLLAYQGKFEESEKELARALELFIKEQEVQSQGVIWAYRALRALLMLNVGSVLKAAKKGRVLADVEKLERDIIQAEWLLGAAYLAKGDLGEAEKHLDESLKRDRKINLVESEPDILLELAKLRFKQNHRDEALKLAKEALGIADRCEYRLKQADIHYFLAEFYLDKKDYKTAKEHADIAKERAECGYKPTMDKAIKLAEFIAEKSKS